MNPKQSLKNSGESMVLSPTKGDNMPVRAIPMDLRAKKVEHELYPFLKALLTLDDEKHVDRLPGLLLMIEKAAYSLTFEEIREAFTKYVNNELPIKPMSNHLDGVLFSNVIDEYKKHRPLKKVEYKNQLSEEEKERNAYLNCIYAYDEWKQDGFLKEEYHWVYDTLKEKGILKTSKEESKSLNEYLREKYPDKDRDYRMKKGKVLLLERMFERLKVHIKEILV